MRRFHGLACLVVVCLIATAPASRVVHAARDGSAALQSTPEPILIANMHGLLFHEDSRDLQEDVNYAEWLGADVIRVFATDNNTAREWNGIQVGAQIVRLAPMLRASGGKLIVALVNNHRAVPGEADWASGWMDDYHQLLLPFFTTTWRGQYLGFMRDLIGSVRDARALDVIAAWELGNELHTPEDPPALIPFVTQAVRELRLVDPSTPILPGTMGANHVQPGVPDSAIARWLYCDAPLDAYTLHAYDWVGPGRSGDMPIEWDLDGITAQPCPNGRALPVIVEELGTSRQLPGLYQFDDEPARLVHELRQLRRALAYPQVVGVGVWNAESPRVRDATFFDSRRGLTSYGRRAFGEGSCYDPRPGTEPGLRCEYEQVLRQLPLVWSDTRASAWLPVDGSSSSGRVVGSARTVADGETLSVAGWVVDTSAAADDDTAIETVDVFDGPPGPSGLRLANGGVTATSFRVQVPQGVLRRGVARLTLVVRTRDGLAWSRTLGAIVPGQMPPPVRLPPLPEPLLQPTQPALPPRLEITSPQPGATISAGHTLQGVVSDPSAPVGESGGGVSRVHVFLEPGRDAGGRLVGSASPSGNGFSVVLRLPRGTHTLYVHAQSTSSGRESVVSLSLKVS